MLDHGCLSELKSNPVDVLYIDNTFCSPKCVLPSRQEAERLIIDVIQQHPMHRVVFGLCGLGKEDILISLANRFNVKVTVSKERYCLLEVLALHEQFVVAGEGSEQTRFEVVELVEITRSSVDAWNARTPTIAVLLTGLFAGIGYQPFTGASDIFIVPLSDHSPYAELHEFVARIRPKSVVPIVRTDPGCRRDDPLAAALFDRANVECFAEHLDPSPMQDYHVPLSVLVMHGNAKSRTRKQASSCIKPVSGMSSLVSASGQTLPPLSSASEVLQSSASSVSSGAVVTTASDSTSDCMRWKLLTTCSDDTVTSAMTRKPRVAVRPMKRCLPLQSGGFSKQQRRHQYWANFPALFELRQNRYDTSEMLRQQRKRLPLGRCTAYCYVPSMATKLNVFPTNDVLSLKQDVGTCERHPDLLVMTTCDEAGESGSTINHAASGSGGSASRNCAESLWHLSGTVQTVLQMAESQAKTGGTTANAVACRQEGYAALNLTTRQPAFHQISESVLNPGKDLNDSRRHVFGNFPMQAISHLSEQLCLQSSSAAMTSSLADESRACNVSAHCNQLQPVETDAGAQLLVNDQMSSAPAGIYHNIASTVNAASASRSVKMSDGERHHSTQSKLGVTLGNCCEIAGDRNTVDAVVMVHTAENASSNHACEVTTVDINSVLTDAQLTSSSFADKPGELQDNVWIASSTHISSLPPKKKWRKQFRSAELHRSHQENRQLNVCDGQTLTAKRPVSASESSKTCPDSSVSSINNANCRKNDSLQSSVCPAAKRTPLLTNYYVAEADISCSRCVVCASCHWSAKTMSRVTGVGRNDCVPWRTPCGSERAVISGMKEQLTSPHLNQRTSAAVATTPLDLSVYRRKPVHRDCRLGKDKDVSDASLFR